MAGLVVAVTQLPHLLGSARRAAAWRRGAAAAVVLLAALVLVLPPLHRVAEAGGTATASTPGELAGQPWHVLVPAVLCLVVLLPHLRQAWAGLLAGTALGLVVSAAVLLRGSGDPTDLEQYYPAKVFWFLTVLLAPLLAVVVTRLAAAALVAASRLAGRLGPGAFVVRAAGVAVLVAIAASLWLPYLLGVESATAATWHRAAPDQRDVATAFPDWSAFRYELATRFGPDDRPEVVVPYTVAVGSSDPYGTRIVSELLGFLTRQPEVLEGRASVCAQIDAVAGDRARGRAHPAPCPGGAGGDGRRRVRRPGRGRAGQPWSGLTGSSSWRRRDGRHQLRLELDDPAEQAVDERRRLVGRQRARQLDRLVDDDRVRHVVAPQQLERAQAQDRAVHRGHPVEGPALRRRSTAARRSAPGARRRPRPARR